MAESLVSYESAEGIGTITLNRPQKLNAITRQMVDELNDALDRAEADDSVDVIILCGAGRAFSAGFDLEEEDPAGANDAAYWAVELQRAMDVIMRFWDCPKPTIAAVHTYCLGSAMEMAVACDITVAAEGCRFGAPEVRFGSGIVALILPWLIGAKAAKELLLTGDDKLSSERALALGLVNRVVPESEVLACAHEFAQRLADNNRFAVRQTKQAINRSFEIMGLREALAEALAVDVKIETATAAAQAESAAVAGEET
jgi:enoyl-CoA hydratase